MPIDLSVLGESLQRGFGEIPPVAVALVLLGGPTLALIGFRLVSAVRRMPGSGQIEAAPYWVCHDCRSVNALRLDKCYHCGMGRDTTQEIEVILDAPIGPPATFDVPAGSPFAALGGRVDPATASLGVPVMGDAADWNTGVPVGPGRADHAIAVPVVAEGGESLLLTNVPPTGKIDETNETAETADALIPARKRRR